MLTCSWSSPPSGAGRGGDRDTAPPPHLHGRTFARLLATSGLGRDLSSAAPTNIGVPEFTEQAVSFLDLRFAIGASAAPATMPVKTVLVLLDGGDGLRCRGADGLTSNGRRENESEQDGIISKHRDHRDDTLAHRRKTM
jgi:hypothetical protein